MPPALLGKSTDVLISAVFFPKNVPFMRICGKLWQSRTGHRWQCNIVHALHTLGRATDIHTHRICNKGKVFPLQARLWPRGWVEV